jgi:inosine-uridine nucleoside N-ribohydrolase
MRTKILLDTDIGSDIDDAVCLAYLLVNPACDLLGITTVTGEGEQRARMASALCQLAGRQVPIFVGAERPLLIEQRQPVCPQAAALSNWEHERDFPRGEAVHLLRQTIRSNPGEVILMSIGPLTNIALLFRVDPQIPALLKGLVMMCGAFNPGRLEWNAMLDPHASAIVYGSRARIHRSIGLDVTTQIKMPAAEVRQVFQTPLLQPVLDFAEVWFQQRESLTFHDPLAATTLFDPAICDFSRGRVGIELNDAATMGKTTWQAEADGPHEVATKVDPDRFYQHFFSFFLER